MIEQRRLKAVHEIEHAIDLLDELADYYVNTGDINRASDMCEAIGTLVEVIANLVS